MQFVLIGMPRLATIILLAFGLLHAAASDGAASDGAAGERFVWSVVAIKDGDTLAVMLPGLPAALNPVAVRIRGIDTPESGGRAKCAAERALADLASRFTARAVGGGRQVEFADLRWDKYGGRIDADVWIDGTLLSGRLIAAGLARPYAGGKRAGWC